MSNLRNFNSNSITWFILVGEGLDKVSRGGSHSFKGYTDHANAHGKGAGAYIEYVTSKDEHNRDKGKFFVFDESRRKFQVREGETDINRITQYNFLKFSPDCEGSPNGTYSEAGGIRVQQGIMFRELNLAKDAEVALQADSKRVLAQSKAYGLDAQTLQEVGAFIGAFGEPDAIMRVKVMNFAEHRPDDFEKLLTSGDRGLRATVRKALADGVFTQKGTLIYWESTLIGGDEDQAISTLQNDKGMLNALSAKINLKEPAKIPPSTPANPRQKPGPKPGSKRGENKKTAPVKHEVPKEPVSL